MKKFIIILLIVIAITGIGIGTYVTIGKDSEFVNTYITNFKDNLFNLRLKYELTKSEREEETAENTNIPVPSESVEDPVETIEASAEPVPTANNKVELSKEFELSSDPIALKGAANARYARFMDGILCALENSVHMYDANGNEKWNRSIQISNPVLKVGGTYFLLFEKGGNKLAVYNSKGQVYSAQTSEPILNGNLSSNGECVVVTEKEYYKGAVNVYNKSGEEIFSRSFGSENVISAAISDSRQLAVALMSVRTQAYSKISFFDVSEELEEKSVEFDNTIIFELDYSGNNLIAYGDDKMISLTSGAREDWVYNYSDKKLNSYAKDSSGVRVLMFDNNNNAEISVITSGGKEKQSLNTDVIPDFCDICDGYIIFNDSRNLTLTKLNGDKIAKYSASRDIDKAYFIDADNILVIYNQSLEFLHVKKIQKQNTAEIK